MSEVQTPSSTSASAVASSRARSRYTARNRLLASIAESESNFKGDIKELAIIGKPHEHGAAYEKITEKLVGYVIKEFKRGADLELLIKSEEDDFTKTTGLSEPTIIDEDGKSKAKTLRYIKLLDMYLMRQDIYTENKEKLFAAVFGQCTPSMVAGLKSQDELKRRNRVRMWCGCYNLFESCLSV